MYESSNAVVHCALEHHVGAQHVRCSKLERVAETQVDVGLCGKVEDCVDLVFLQTSHDFRLVGDIAVAERETLPALHTLDVVQRGAVIKFVEAYDMVGGWVCQTEMSNQPGSDEPSSPS